MSSSMRWIRHVLAAGWICGTVCSGSLEAQLARRSTDLRGPEVEERSSGPRNFVRRGELVYFSAAEALFATDGTQDGTLAVLDDAKILAFDDDDVWIQQDGKLWWWNGAPGNAAVLHELAGSFGNSFDSQALWIDQQTVALVRASLDSPLVLAGRETAVALGSAASLGSHAATEDHIFFLGGGTDLYVSDGSQSGTFRVADGIGSSQVFSLLATPRYVYARDPFTPAAQGKFIRSDGTVRGTVDLFDVHPELLFGALVAQSDNLYAVAQETSTGTIGIWRLSDDSNRFERLLIAEGASSLNRLSIQETEVGVFALIESTASEVELLFWEHGASEPLLRKSELRRQVALIDAEAYELLYDDGGVHHLDARFEGDRNLGIERRDLTWVEGLGWVASANPQSDGESSLELIRAAGLQRTPLGRARGVAPGVLQTGAALAGNSLIWRGRDEALAIGDEPYALDLGSGTGGLLANLRSDRQPPDLLEGTGLVATFRLATRGSSSPSFGRADREGWAPFPVADDCRPDSGARQLGESLLMRCGGGLEAIDIRTGERQPLHPGLGHLDAARPAGEGSLLIDAGQDGVWITSGSPTTTQQIDPGEVVAFAQHGRRALALVADDWPDPIVRLVDSDGTTSGSRIVELPLPGLPVGSSISAAVATERWVYWLSEPIIRIDRQTGEFESVESPHGLVSTPAVTPLAFDTHLDVFYRELGGAVFRYRLDDTSMSFELIEAHDFRLVSDFQTTRLGDMQIVRLQTGDLLFVPKAGDSVLYEPPGRMTGELTRVGNQAFFTLDQNGLGAELWSTDGTVEGTRLVQDLRPGPLSSDPEQLQARGNVLFFVADDGLSGAQVWSLDPEAASCQPSPRTLCLRDGRFQVTTVWGSATEPAGTVELGVADTGGFWFFDEGNVEMLVKSLDGRAINGHFWTFVGAATDVPFTLDITDGQTGKSSRYRNPAGRFASFGDVFSIDQTTPVGPASAAPTPPTATLRAAQPGPCSGSSQSVCLQNGRFEARVRYSDFADRSGQAEGTSISDASATFTFFDPDNLELLVKVLDGRTINGHFWLLLGSLSNVGFELEIRDTLTGVVRTWSNPIGEFASFGDVEALPDMSATAGTAVGVRNP